MATEPTSPTATQRFESLGVQRYVGVGAPVILIPGLADGPWAWEGLDRRLAPAHPVFSLTLPGFDGQPMVPSPLIDRVIADLASLIVRSHIKRPILVGHSLGGFIAYRFAIEHPDLLGGLVSVEGFPVFPPLADADVAGRHQFAGKLAHDLAVGKSQSEFHDAMLTFLIARINDPAKATELADLAAHSDPKAVAEYLKEMLPGDLRPDLGKIKVPVLALVAMNSYKNGASEAEIRTFYSALLANVPQAQIEIIHHARHFVMVDQPAVVGEAIDGFLRENDASPRKP
jgi:pimeloyl-ACP methyl ester carboxylesterase